MEHLKYCIIYLLVVDQLTKAMFRLFSSVGERQKISNFNAGPIR